MIANVWSKVQDIATREPVAVTPQMSLRVATEVIARKSIGAVLTASLDR